MQCTFTEKQNEETMGNDNGTQSKTERISETTEVKDLDNMTVTRDERPGHRVLADDVIDLCDFSSTAMLEVAVSPTCDINVGKSDGNEIENDAVRTKRDKQNVKKMMRLQVKMKNKRLIEERRNTASGEKYHLREVSKQVRKCIRDKKDQKGKKNTTNP